MEKKIRSCIKEKGLLDSTKVIMGPPFTEEIIAYLNTTKLKPLLIDPYNKTKDHVDLV